MHACMYVCMYLCVHVCMFVCLYVCTTSVSLVLSFVLSFCAHPPPCPPAVVQLSRCAQVCKTLRTIVESKCLSEMCTAEFLHTAECYAHSKVLREMHNATHTQRTIQSFNVELRVTLINR